MNLVFVTQHEPFYIKHFFKVFLKNYHYRSEIKGIIIQDTLNEKSQTAFYRKILSFYGIHGFFSMGLQYVFLQISDIISTITGISIAFTLSAILKKYGIPIVQYKSVNDKKFIDYIKNENISVVVSVAASEIFKKEVLQAPPLGCINMHSGPLPKYRGMMPSFWTLFNKEEYAWVTIHMMTEKLDDGPIILQDKFKIKDGETYNSLARRSKEFGAELMCKALNSLLEGNVTCSPNDSSKATYYTFPTKQEVKTFKKNGGRIL